MRSQNDHELLRSFAKNGSQDAFTQLVERHVNLVYSAAHRLVPDQHLAEDVTQQVFALLARKAGGLGIGTILPGWLYRTARNVASEALRRERRRERREQLAVEAMNLSTPDSTWKQIEPLLDDAMASLRSSDHDAIVLRYLDNRSLKEVGEAFGWSEDAAQKRLARALSRLRTSLTRRGVTVSVTALGAAVTSGAVQSAPVGLAASAVSASILAAGGTSWAPHFISHMTTTKLKLVAIAAIVGVLSLSLVLVCRQNTSLRRQVEALRASTVEPARFSGVGSRSSEPGISSNELRRLRFEHLEVLSLRGRVTQLTTELRQRKAGQEQATAAADLPSEAGDSILFTAAVTNRVGSGHTLVVGGWAKDGMRGYLLATPVIKRDDTVPHGRPLVVQSQVVGAPETFWEQIGWGNSKSDNRRSTVAGVLNPEELDALLALLKETAGAEIANTSSVTNRDGERLGFTFSTDDDRGAGIVMGLEFCPRITTEGDAVDLELRPSAVSPEDVHSSLKQGSEATSSRPR